MHIATVKPVLSDHAWAKKVNRGGLLIEVKMHGKATMDLMQNYQKLVKIINFKGAGGPMFKTCQCAPYIAVMTISEFEPHTVEGSIHELCMLKGSLSP